VGGAGGHPYTLTIRTDIMCIIGPILTGVGEAGRSSTIPGPSRHQTNTSQICAYIGTIMCMSLTHRLQVLLDEDQYARLATQARVENRSIGSLIRQAVDQVWSTPDEQKVALLEAILAEQPMPVPDPDELSHELDSIRGERFLGV
jgi:hypothetical protein